jgi:hypothetical protein
MIIFYSYNRLEHIAVSVFITGVKNLQIGRRQNDNRFFTSLNLGTQL